MRPGTLKVPVVASKDDRPTIGSDEASCSRCHNGGAARATAEFKALKGFPRAPYGNKIDWIDAENRGLIEPKKSILEPDFDPIPYDQEFEVPAAWTMISPGYFSHGEHIRWLECSDCHPDIFAIDKKGTRHFRMAHILDGKFCGACHMKVAFPIDDCKGCHPRMNY